MTVKSSELQNPERDLDLTNRDPKGTQKVAADIQRVKDGTSTTAEEELQALRLRIRAAKIVGKDAQPHCSDCFSRGWMAAVREIAGE